MTPSNRMDIFLSHLRAALPADDPGAGRFLAEAEDHLFEAIGSLQDAGRTREEAEREAIARFGAPLEVVQSFLADDGTLAAQSAPNPTGDSAGQRRPFPPPNTNNRKGDGLMKTFVRDLQYAIRTLTKSPAFTGVAVLTLALGIGATTLIFSVVNSILLEPLPYPDAERIVWIWGTRPNVKYATFSTADFYAHSMRNTMFAEFVAFPSGGGSVNLTGGRSPERVPTLRVSEGFFRIFSTPPVLGQTFQPEDHEVGNNNVVVISEGFWQRHFGGDSGAVGQTLDLDGVSHRVIGVMPEAGKYRPWAEMWIPIALTEEQKSARGSNYLNIVGKLRSGVPLEQADSELKAIAADIDSLHRSSGYSVWLESFHERTVGFIRPALTLVLLAVGVLLLIACANIANLMLVRAVAREKEIAIRAALGADLYRLAQQFWVESLLVATLGGLTGWGLAAGGLQLLKRFNPGNLPRLSDVGLDVTVMIVSAGLVFLTSVLFSLPPAFYFARTDLNKVLREGGRRSTAGGGQGFRRAMVIGEIALSLMLLVVAGLLTRSLTNLQGTDPGFDPSNLLTLQVNLPSGRYAEPESQQAFYQQILTRVEQRPGVESAAWVRPLPFSGANTNCRVWIPGKPEWDADRYEPVELVAATPDYFQTMRIPIRAGRGFTRADVDQSARLGIVSEGMAKDIWPGEDPVGKRIRWCGSAEGGGYELDVVGVAGDIRQMGLGESARPTLYAPSVQFSSMALVVRSGGVPASQASLTSLVSMVRNEVASLDASLPVFAVRTMDEYLHRSTARPRFNTLLIGLFAGLALVLALVGLYGVISYSVTRQIHEIGIRIALGAQKIDVLKLVLVEGLKMTLAGIGLGLVGSYLVGSYLSSLLFGVSATDPVTLMTVPVLLVVVTLVASYMPARRAMSVDPMVALRYE